jgi:hypothetical protein
MLTTWLLHHIKRDDAAYASATKNHLIGAAHNRTATGWLNRTVGLLFNLASGPLVPTVPVVPADAQLSVPTLLKGTYRSTRSSAAVSRD